MVIFPMIILVSIFLYIYYKIIIIRTEDGLTQHYLNAKSRICLGTFMLFFGMNQYLFYQTKLSLFIASLFGFLGVLQFIRGVKETKHYRGEIKRLELK